VALAGGVVALATASPTALSVLVAADVLLGRRPRSVMSGHRWRPDPYFAEAGSVGGPDGRPPSFADDGDMSTALRQNRSQAPAFDRAAVRDAMSTGVVACSPETPLRAVARTMSKHRVHAIFIFEWGAESDEQATLWGLVSDLDLVAAANGDLDALTARQASVTPLLTVRSDDPLGDAAQRMAETGVSHLAVIDAATGRPAGVLSTLDIVRFVAHEHDEHL
jgi:CBS domain-containing protein